MCSSICLLRCPTCLTTGKTSRFLPFLRNMAACTCMCLYVCICACMCVCMCVCMCICTFVCMCTYVPVCVFVCLSMAAVCVHACLLSCLLTGRPMYLWLRQKECLLTAPLPPPTQLFG